jgi:guanylate kinase
MTANLTVIAGPTAVGKGTVIKHILEHNPQIKLSVSATTRTPRPGEVDGVSYFFMTKPEFESKIAQGEMLEWAQVHGDNYYGTPKQPVLDALNAGQSVILEIDLQGVRQVRQAWPDAKFIFIAPPSWDELVSRLRGRGTETEEQMAKRLETAKVELAAESEFDVTVINNEVAECAAKVVELIQS